MKIVLRKVRENRETADSKKGEHKIVIHLSSEPLEGKKTFVITSKGGMLEATPDEHAEQERKEEIDRMVDLAIKSGIVTETIH